MKRIVLFTGPADKNIKQLSELLLPKEAKAKVLAYMPANAKKAKPVYIDYWRKIAREQEANFSFVDNTLPPSAGEAGKIEKATTLLISGGKTFELLQNLRQSGLDEVIKDFAKKDNFILGGFSAGAIILAPTIGVCNLPGYDVNEVGITDLSGLGVLNFEVFPHYDDNMKRLLDGYRKSAKYPVREITNDGYITLELL